MIRIDPNTRIIDLTVGELMELLETIKTTPQEAPKTPEKRIVYGIAGRSLGLHVQTSYRCLNYLTTKGRGMFQIVCDRIL